MPAHRSGFGAAIRDLGGAFLPLSVRDLERRIDDRLRKLPTELNEYGFDRFGMSPERARVAARLSALLYRYYFRVETHGIERVPAGRVLVVANHAGQLPFDAAMLATAMLLEADPPRMVRAMGEYWIPSIPFFNLMASRTGTLVGTPENCIAVLEAGECVMVFPEGVRGMNKPFRERYRLQRFGLGFMRLALETDTPIVPVGIVGSEEQQPGLANLAGLGRLLGIPAFPLTLGFPWLGPLGILPLPVKYHLHFGEPLHFTGDSTDEDAAIETRVGEVRRAIARLLAHGRRTRHGIFRG
jgi:1-acyl-sn-glycerol-3-phosphate acyltransferase